MGIRLLRILIFWVGFEVLVLPASACEMAFNLFKALGPLPHNINPQIPVQIQNSLAANHRINIGDLNAAYKFAEYFGITITDSFKERRSHEQLKTLNILFNQISLLPPGIIKKIKQQVKIDLVADNVTESTFFNAYYDQKVMYDVISKQPVVRLFQEVGGCASNKCLAVASRCVNRPESKNILLHELGHAIDSVYGMISLSAKYAKIHDVIGLKRSYFQASPLESFAEGFAMFFESIDRRKELELIDYRLHDFILVHIYEPNLSVD